MRHLAAIALLALSAAHADSLYTPTSGFRSLFADRRAVAVGDVLHILVTETAQANQTVNNSTQSTTAANLGPGLGKLSFLPLLKYQGDIAAQSKGSASRSETLTARVAVTVVEVTPAGNLKVEGSRQVAVNNDRQLIKLCGEVRPEDVTADNTVPSYKVADATISYTGSDPLKPGKKVGIITRLLHWVF
ncbi:MAG: flagellar basal body L-ring protein FlgH [Armatimonadia bacterium]